jgi:galactokinase
MPNPLSSLDFAASSLSRRFQAHYAKPARILLAPGRVNLIGEHTDYNDGFVMPAAIDSYTLVAVAKRDDPVLNMRSEHFGESVQLPLTALSGPPRRHWSDYVRGVAAVLQASGRVLSGADLLVSSQLPLGAGLSSSASLEVATALAVMSASGLDVPPLELARICQRAEHEYAGTRCGIMDQFIAVFGCAASALLLDCRSLDHQLLPLPGDVRIVICNSMVRHAHAAGEYNLRRTDCEIGVSVLKQLMPGIRALRDVSVAELQRHKDQLAPKVYRRCRHVVGENQRVLEAAKAIRDLDLPRFGALMYESHNSLRNDYEVSCRELDVLVEMASTCDGVYGARMTGGGFGGCTVNLVRSSLVGDFQAQMTAGYKKAIGITPEIYICAAARGARAWQPSLE